MSDIEKVLADVDEYLSATGMKETTFGRLAVNDGKCIARLRKGGRAWPETIAKITEFMSSSREARTPPSSEAA
jgi:tRNA-dihydrouridine synthase